MSELVKKGLRPDSTQKWCTSKAGRPSDWADKVDKRNKVWGNEGRAWEPETDEQDRAVRRTHDVEDGASCEGRSVHTFIAGDRCAGWV